MTTATITEESVNLVTHSPDGESRGLLFRVGDLFPMDPRPHQRSAIGEPASDARPWGLRYATAPRAGRHEADTAKHTTGANGDSVSKEDEGTD